MMGIGSPRLHPLVAGAAVSVIVVSLLGVAAITGHLPGAHGSTDANVGSTAGNIGPSTIAAPIPNGPPALTGMPPPPPNSTTMQGPAPTGQLQVSGDQQLCQSCGTVLAVREIQRQSPTSGIGAVAGAVLGGLVGNRFGGGNGRVLTTVGGAVGGGIAGNEIEKSRQHSATYQVVVKMSNGKVRKFSYNEKPGWNVGDSVAIADGTLIARK